MSDQPIAAEVLEAAAKAAFDAEELSQRVPLAWADEDETGKAEYRVSAEAAIRAADLERGLSTERRGDRPGLQRLVGPWVPVGGEAGA